MDIAIAICAFFGGWFILAGSVYQAALELRAEEFDREAMEAVSSSVPKPDKISPWWWLLPPVAFFRNSTRSRNYQRAVMEKLEPAQVEQTVNFMNKARGWLVVGLGALLLGIRETWELTVALDWPIVVFFVLVVLSFLLCVGYTAVSIRSSDLMLKKDDENARQRRRKAGPSARA